MISRIPPGQMLPGLLLAVLLPLFASAQDSATSSKVGIDPVTGQLRPLTDAESAALDQATPATASSARSSAQRAAIPRTEAESMATTRTLANGTVARKVPLTQMSTLTAVRNADGSISIAHGDEHGTHTGQEGNPSE